MMMIFHDGSRNILTMFRNKKLLLEIADKWNSPFDIIINAILMINRNASMYDGF